MLANRLSVLLAERGLKIPDIIKKTGLSRNTISNLINKPSSNISIDTVDKLCNYLCVEPKDFFIYSPYRFEFSDSDEGYSVTTQKGSQITTDWIKFSISNEYQLASDEAPFTPLILQNDYFINIFSTTNDDCNNEYIFNFEKALYSLEPLFFNQIKNEIISKSIEIFKNKMINKKGKTFNVNITFFNREQEGKQIKI